MFFLVILLGLPSILGLLYIFVTRTRNKKAVTVDEEKAMAEDGLTKVNRIKKGNCAPIQDNLYAILESDEELIIDDTKTLAHLAEDSSDSEDEELVVHVDVHVDGVFSI